MRETARAVLMLVSILTTLGLTVGCLFASWVAANGGRTGDAFLWLAAGLGVAAFTKDAIEDEIDRLEADDA